MQNKNGLVHFELTGTILSCCFEVMKELGAGFLESVYKNALFIAMKQKGMNVFTEQAFEVVFRQQKIGRYIADLVVENAVIVELKCCGSLLSEHQAQLINYLTVADISIGLLINFGHSKLEYKRLCHPKICEKKDILDPLDSIFTFAEMNQ